MAGPWYASREVIASASDTKTTAYQFDTIDRLAEVASRGIERSLRRTFYPTIQTVTMSWPVPLWGPYWLPADLLSATSISIDGTASTGYTLEPQQYGPPYDRVDFTDATVTGGEVIAVTGVWGFSNDTATAGTLAAAISSTTATTCTVSNAALVGVGDQLLVDSERVVVTGRSSATTGTTLGGNLTAAASETTVPVASGAAVNAGETITIDSERMRVLDVVSNNLLVRRAVDGSVLATHTSGATVYAPRLLTVTRAHAGTTAATHLSAAVVYRNVPPPLISELCVAEAQTLLGQEASAWNLTVGSGEGERESAGRQLKLIKAEAEALYRRRRPQAVI